MVTPLAPFDLGGAHVDGLSSFVCLHCRLTASAAQGIEEGSGTESGNPVMQWAG